MIFFWNNQLIVKAQLSRRKDVLARLKMGEFGLLWSLLLHQWLLLVSQWNCGWKDIGSTWEIVRSKLWRKRVKTKSRPNTSLSSWFFAFFLSQKKDLTSVLWQFCTPEIVISWFCFTSFQVYNGVLKSSVLTSIFSSRMHLKRLQEFCFFTTASFVTRRALNITS